MGYVNIKELAEAMCKYDLDDMDLYWLQQLNAELGQMGKLVKNSIFSLAQSNMKLHSTICVFQVMGRWMS